MKKIIDWLKKNTFSILIGIVLLVVGLSFVNILPEASDDIKAAVIGIFGTAIIAIYANYESRQREIEARHFAEKRQAYMAFVDIFFSLLNNAVSEKSKPKEIQKKQKPLPVKEMIEFKKNLMFWGSAKAIQAWNDYETKDK